MKIRVFRGLKIKGINVNLPIQTENATNDLELFLNTHRTASSTIYVDMDNTIAGFNIKLAELGLTPGVAVKFG